MSKTVADYILRVRVGAGADSSKYTTINVNDETNPILIDTDHFTGYLIVRMLHYHGVTPPGAKLISDPASSYFVGRHRRYSIVVQGRWKKSWSGDDILFGIDTDSAVRTPPGTAMAIRIAKWLDPALDADVTSNSPWVYSPFVSAMNALAIYPPDAPEVNDCVPTTSTDSTSSLSAGVGSSTSQSTTSKDHGGSGGGG
ncbi:hypothetical protein HDV05_008739, partial [Chytridiales sp. JEL 0842]